MAQLTATLINGNLRVTGDSFMSGLLTLKSGQYDDSITSSTSHALNLQNSNIIGINALYTADSAENAAEGIHFFRDSTHFDSLWASGGYLYFTPNRALGAQTGSADSRKVGILPASITTNQVVLTDGTNGYLKTLAASSLAAGSCEYPAGFANRNTTASWGTHTGGTLVTDWADGSGGDIAFWKNYPSSGQLSVLVDGCFVQREGLYKCLDTGDIGSTVAAYSHNHDNTYLKLSNTSQIIFNGEDGIPVSAGSDYWVKLMDFTFTGNASGDNFNYYWNPSITCFYNSRHTGSGTLDISCQINGAAAKTNTSAMTINSLNVSIVDTGILNQRINNPIRAYTRFTAQTTTTAASWHVVIVASCSDYNKLYITGMPTLRNDGVSSFKLCEGTKEYCTSNNLTATYGTYVAGNQHYAGGTRLTVNQTSYGGTSVGIFAPTSVAGSSGARAGYIVYSNGDGNATWENRTNITVGQANKLTDRTNSGKYAQVSYWGSGTITGSNNVKYIAGFFEPDGDSSSVICDVPPAKLTAYLSSTANVALQNGTYSSMTVGNSNKVNNWSIVVGSIGTSTSTLYFV